MAENSPLGARMALMAALSVRNFGGQLSSSPLRTYLPPGPPGPYQAQLARVGAEIVHLQPAGRPEVAKARALQDHAERGRGTLVVLGAGIVVLGDLASEAGPEALRGVPERSSPLTEEQWARWLELRGLSADPGAVPYLSSAVLLVPESACSAVARAWAGQAQALAEAFALPPSAAPGLPEQARPFTEELALTCAIIETGTPFEPLPPGCHFRPDKEYVEVAGIGQVHALKAVDCNAALGDDGLVHRGRFLPLNPDLERLNKLAAAHLGIPYRSRGPRPAPRAVGSSWAKPYSVLRHRAGAAVRKSAPWLLPSRRQAS